MKAALFVALLFCVGAQAGVRDNLVPQPRCSRMEFAELQSLNAKELKVRYCAIDRSFSYWSLAGSLENQAVCGDELTRIYRHKEYPNFDKSCPGEFPENV